MAIRIRIRRAAAKRSQRLFTLTAEPRLKPDGPVRGYLDYVVFTARAKDGLQMWLAEKYGRFIEDFSALVAPELAVDIVTELYLGHSVAVPGRFRIEQLRGRFGFPGDEKPG